MLEAQSSTVETFGWWQTEEYVPPPVVDVSAGMSVWDRSYIISRFVSHSQSSRLIQLAWEWDTILNMASYIYSWDSGTSCITKSTRGHCLELPMLCIMDQLTSTHHTPLNVHLFLTAPSPQNYKEGHISTHRIWWQGRTSINPHLVKLWNCFLFSQGKVPRNEYGNVELFQPSMLPPGACHIKSELM